MDRNKIQIDDYILIKTIGMGAYGRVYLSKSKLDDNYYAVKSLKKAEILKLKQTEHIYNEYIILKEKKHKFIVIYFIIG